MSIEMAMWRIDSGLSRIEPGRLDLEQRLESILAQDISVLSPHWLVVGRQVQTPWNKTIDLLCVDINGRLVLVELKRNKTEREIVAQALDYASYVAALQTDDVRRIFSEYQKKYMPSAPAKTIEEAFGVTFGGIAVPEEFGANHEIVIVASSLDTATERIVNYLADHYDVRINAVFFRVFKDKDREYLTRAWLRDSEGEEGRASTSVRAGARVAFNGEYYVNFGDDRHRKWEDAIRFDFVSAGHGPRYRDAIQRLEPRNRFWVNVPGSGFVGVGIIEAAAVPVSEFIVSGEGGQRIPLLQAGLSCKEMGDRADDLDFCEYAARVKWLKTVSLDQAIWEPGFFANQNCVAEPRDAKWQYTVDRLKQRFGIAE